MPFLLTLYFLCDKLEYISGLRVPPAGSEHSIREHASLLGVKPAMKSVWHWSWHTEPTGLLFSQSSIWILQGVEQWTAGLNGLHFHQQGLDPWGQDTTTPQRIHIMHHLILLSTFQQSKTDVCPALTILINFIYHVHFYDTFCFT